jgi:hypothetical protein
MDKACKFDAITLEIAGLPLGIRGRAPEIGGPKQSDAAI